MDPNTQFTQWQEEELRLTPDNIPSACCLSTIGIDGFPNARTVSLKDLADGRFIITCPLNSRKAMEIERDHKVALTFWWTNTERQVRIQGTAARISDADADRYFAEREAHIKILTWASEQGHPLKDMQELKVKFEKEKERLGADIPRPEKWGGFAITPVRIEFMQFKHSRFHERELYERELAGWRRVMLQP